MEIFGIIMMSFLSLVGLASVVFGIFLMVRMFKEMLEK